MTIKNFIKENRATIIGVLILGIITYGIKLVTYSFSIDTEVLLTQRQTLLNSWITIGRYGLVLFKNIIDLAYINIYLANAIAFILLYISTIICIYNITIITNKTNKTSNMLLGMIIITSPIIVEQFNFTLQCVEIMLALLLFNLAFTIINKVIVNNSKYYLMSISIIFITIAFSCYQTFIPLMITLSTFFIIIFCQEKNETKFKIILKYGLIFIISIVLYLIINEIVIYFTNIEKTTYLSGQILWGKENVFKIILRIMKNIIGTFTAISSAHFNLGMLIGEIIFIVYIIKNFNIKNWVFYISALMFLVSPFLLKIFIGGYIAIRTQFSIPYVTGLLAFFIYNYIKNITIRKRIVIFFSIIIIYQTVISVLLFYTDLNVFKQELKLADNIKIELNEKNLENKPIIFVGKFSPEGNGIILKGEVMGWSFFEWDKETPLASNERIKGFLNSIGNKYEYASEKQFKEAKVISTQMNSYPEEGYIKEEKDYIIINLGE